MSDDGQGFSACLQLLESVSEDLLAAAARKCAADHGLVMPGQFTLTVTPEARRDIAKVSLELCLDLIGQRVLERQLEAKAAARRKLP